jgi:hypothetical protein
MKLILRRKEEKNGNKNGGQISYILYNTYIYTIAWPGEQNNRIIPPTSVKKTTPRVANNS